MIASKGSDQPPEVTAESDYGRINGKNIIRTGTVIIADTEEFEFDYQNATYVMQFIKNEASPEHRAYGKAISAERYKFTFENMSNSLGTAVSFGAGSTEMGPLIIRFFVHTIGVDGPTQRLVNYTLMLDPKAL